MRLNAIQDAGHQKLGPHWRTARARHLRANGKAVRIAGRQTVVGPVQNKPRVHQCCHGRVKLFILGDGIHRKFRTELRAVGVENLRPDPVGCEHSGRLRLLGPAYHKAAVGQRRDGRRNMVPAGGRIDPELVAKPTAIGVVNLRADLRENARADQSGWHRTMSPNTFRWPRW